MADIAKLVSCSFNVPEYTMQLNTASTSWIIIPITILLIAMLLTPDGVTRLFRRKRRDPPSGIVDADTFMDLLMTLKPRTLEIAAGQDGNSVRFRFIFTVNSDTETRTYATTCVRIPSENDPIGRLPTGYNILFARASPCGNPNRCRDARQTHKLLAEPAAVLADEFDF